MNNNIYCLFIRLGNFFNNAGVGAFLGAFFAFGFGIVAYDYTKKRERWKLHHDAVVKAEYLINRHLNQISGSILLLKGAVEAYSKGVFSENILIPVENPNFLQDFYNLQIINTYANYQALLEKVNHDLESWNRSNDRMFTAALSGRISLADIRKNRANLSNRTEQIISHLEDLMNEAYTTGAYIRVFLKADKRPKFANLNQTANIKITTKQITAERKILVKESKENMKKDREGRLKKYKKT